MKIRFTKMHGAGNDYIYVDTTKQSIAHPEILAEHWSHPHTGIGSDGLVLIGNSSKADFSMRIFNADGSEARMCGNASRCIGKYLYDHKLTHNKVITLDTLSGIKTLHLHINEQDKVDYVTVDMGIPTDIHQVKLGSEYPYNETIALSMGNPHLVIFVPNISQINLKEIGPKLEHHPLFPDGVNIEFVQNTAYNNQLRMRVWERGSGITLACGTGACATLAAAVFTGRCTHEADIEMDGGILHIEYDKATGHIHMTGPATEVYEGIIEYEI